MSGQKLFGVPIIVQPTMAEKNRQAHMHEKPDPSHRAIPFAVMDCGD